MFDAGAFHTTKDGLLGDRDKPVPTSARMPRIPFRLLPYVGDEKMGARRLDAGFVKRTRERGRERTRPVAFSEISRRGHAIFCRDGL